MNDAVTISTQTYFGTPDSLLSPLHLSSAKESSLENWNPLLSAVRPTPHKNTTKMPSRTDNNGSAEPLNASRWRVNSSGQLVSAEANPGWDLADEIVRLKIGDVTGEADNGRMRTPPKSVLATTAVAQLTESSPLDSNSAPSVDSSPDGSTRAMAIPHSRESSGDTSTSDSHEASSSPPKDLGLQPVDNRPWDAISPVDQPSYPSLMAQTAPRQQYDYRSTTQGTEAANGDDLQIDYSLPHRNYNPIPQGSPSFPNGRPAPANVAPVYRQPPPLRGYAGQGLIPSPTGMAYPGGHQSSSSLGNSQQLYDMMLPGAPDNHPAIARLQQQHNVYPPRTHHRSISDSSSVPDVNSIALMTGNMQSYGAPGIYPGMPQALPMYNQFYGATDPYGRVTEAQALAAAARLQQSYNSQVASNGPSANNRKLGLYKTELCRSWEEKGSCRYGAKCQFAHGEEELRTVQRHPKYKTEICRTFWVSGSCPYGKRCCFIHTELPQGAAGAPPPAGADGNAPAASRPDNRARSGSTTSDPSDAPVSLLARIKRENAGTPVDVNSANGLLRPGSLRVDTSALDTNVSKQNKSAYPTFPGNNIMFPQPEQVNKRSSPAPAGPVTAGPDFGRHLGARLSIVGSNDQRPGHRQTPSNSSQRDTEGLTPTTQGGHQYSLSGDSGRINGHVRGSSAGNWSSLARNLGPSPAQYSAASPVGERPMNSPWTTTELVAGGGKKAAWP